MKKSGLMLIMFLAAETKVAHAATGLASESGKIQTPSFRSVVSSQRDLQEASYTLKRGGLATSVTETPNGNDYVRLAFPAGTEVNVLSIDVEKKLIHIGIDTDEDDALPSDLYLDLEEFLRLSPELISESEFATAEEENANGPQMDAYEEVDVATDFAGHHKRGKLHRAKRRKGKTPGCYRDVKKMLLRRGQVHKYLEGGAAYQGYSALLQSGFHSVPFSEDLPNGAVCVSEGGRWRCGKKKCGHIAVKTGIKKWYGAGTFPHPLLRGHYNLRCLSK